MIQTGVPVVTRYGWDQIWTLPCFNLHKVVKTRKAKIARATYTEKLDHSFAPYTIVNDLCKIKR